MAHRHLQWCTSPMLATMIAVIQLLANSWSFELGPALCSTLRKKGNQNSSPWGAVCLSVTQPPLWRYFGAIFQNGSLRELFWLHFFSQCITWWAIFLTSYHTTVAQAMVQEDHALRVSSIIHAVCVFHTKMLVCCRNLPYHEVIFHK